jgi:hypothetical protein
MLHTAESRKTLGFTLHDGRVIETLGYLGEFEKDF